MPQSFPRRKIEDAELERLLAAVLDHHESMPESLSDAAGALFGLRAVDEELAGLVEDSAERLTSGVREGAEHERVAVFATDRHTIELVIRDDAVLGQVVPEVQGAGQIWDASGMVVEFPLIAGRFRLEARLAGPIRVAFASQAARVTTPWIMTGPRHPTP